MIGELMKKFAIGCVASLMCGVVCAGVSLEQHCRATRQIGEVRTIDLVDMRERPGRVQQHRGCTCKRTFHVEDGVAFARFAVKSAPGGWSGCAFTEAVPEGTSALEFVGRSNGQKEKSIGVTISDSNGQNYQYSSKIAAGFTWGTTRLDLSQKPRNAWKNGGGKPDGTLHFPLLSVCVECCDGSYDLAGYRAVTTAGREALPDFSIAAKPTKIHGLWYPADKVEYELEIRQRTQGVVVPAKIEWSLTDFWKGETIASGVWRSGDGKLSFDSDLLKRRFGSFRLSLAAGEGEGRVKRDAWFARLTGPDPEPCRWIGSIGGDESWDLFRAMGVGTMNTSVGWNQCEPKKGEYVFPQWFDNYVTNMLAHGIKLHAMTHCPNKIYENPLDPEAFAKYAAAYARHLWSLGVDGVEIWNEPRGPFAQQYGRKDRSYVAKFVEFTRMARDAIKAEVPDMTVMVCAEDMPWDLEPMITNGIARAGDAITFHPYCHEQPRPERSYFLQDNGRRIKDLAAKHGGATRFRISEFGWTTYTGKGEYLEIAGHYPRASYAHQAQYLVRNYIIARQSGVDYACQYRFDDKHRRNYTEHNFGFVFEDYTPKPSFCAVAFMSRLIGKAEPIGELSDDLGLYRASLFARSGRKILVCWAVEKDVMWMLPEDFGKVARSFDMMGNEISPPFSKERCLRLTERPFYLVGEKL